MSKTRGRPQKTNADINVKDLLVEYLSTKPDDYNNNICYFKIIDSEFKLKLKTLFSLNSDFKTPMWKSDDKNEYILKKKRKHIKPGNPALMFKSKENYSIHVNFVYYDMASQNIKGYYGVLTGYSPKTNIEVAVTENN